MAAVTVQYLVKRVRNREQTALQQGMPSQQVADVSQANNDMVTDEEVTYAAQSLLVLDIAQPLDVQLSIRNADNSVSVVRRDVVGLLVWSGPCAVTVRCPQRFGYTIPVPLRAVYC